MTRYELTDGEIVAFKGGQTSFERLQQRMQIRDPERALSSGVAVHYYLFDLLELDGCDLRDRPLLGALLVGCWESGKLRYAGKVGTRFDEQTLELLGDELVRVRAPRRARGSGAGRDRAPVDRLPAACARAGRAAGGASRERFGRSAEPLQRLTERDGYGILACRWAM